MLVNGYVKLYRKILDHPIFTQLPASVLKVWMVCLIRANIEPSRWYDGRQQIDIPAGAFIFSQETLAKDCHLSRHQIRTALQHLQNLRCVAIRSTSRYSLLVIEKWSIYQLTGPVQGQVDGQQMAISGPADGQQAATEGEYKKARRKELAAARSPADGDWPETTWAITQRFETASSQFVCRVIEAAFAALHKNGGQPGDLVDTVLAGIVRDAIAAKPRGEAGLLLDTVPEIIESRLLREKRRKAASEAARRRKGPEPASRSQEGLFLIEEKQS